MSSTEAYIAQFGDISKLDRKILLAEMDSAWISLGIDNKRKVSDQPDLINQFYTHPVWALNGLFSELDPVSRQHRESIANFISHISHTRIADFGGGSGVLARIIAARCPDSVIDVIEPFLSEEALTKVSSNISYRRNLSCEYEIIIAQDVLEHVDYPLDLAQKLISSTKMGGHVIFANSFYPEIKCHLPGTFYLRHTFRFLMKFAGLEFLGTVEGARHVQIFKRVASIEKDKLSRMHKVAKILGPCINFSIEIAKKLKRELTHR